LTPDPSPKLGRGEKILFPFSQTWEKKLGDVELCSSRRVGLNREGIGFTDNEIAGLFQKRDKSVEIEQLKFPDLH
ncbi:MAG: hypothetical protein QNJ46_29440, partial [Leptolyngbyaceae cyanobacterium MO_188.B28]|nr:hypothetical protein [Leptolyngbyaceae cyanobacterium MO_188.B28]